MAHATSGKLKIGRYPATWQAVPVGSFIQTSLSQPVISEECGEHPANRSVTKKDVGDSKSFTSRKKDGNWNKNRSLSMEEPGDNTSYVNEVCTTRKKLNPNSAQRHIGASPKNADSTTFHPLFESLFLSNEDEFPSLSASADTKVTPAITTTQKAFWCAHASYSEKLKHAHHATQQGRTGNSTSENGRQAGSCQGSLSNHTSSIRHKKSTLGNGKSHLITSTTSNRKDLSNPQWRTSPINKKHTFSGIKDENHFDRKRIDHILKTGNENQIGRNFSSDFKWERSHKVRENGGDDVRSSFSRRTQGNSLSKNMNTRYGSAVAGNIVGASNSQRVEGVQIQVGNDLLLPPKITSERPVLTEREGESLRSEVCYYGGNMPTSSRGGGKTRGDAKKTSSKATSKHPATGEDRERYNISSELLTNQENVANPQPGSSAKASKKHKKRKSKLKRNLAFQTGKIMILTPELYSRFTAGREMGPCRTTQNFSFDLSDMEEYPELGQVSSLKSCQKNIKPEAVDSSTNSECDPATSSFGISTEITSQEIASTCQRTSLSLKTAVGTVSVSEHGTHNITEEAVKRSDAGTYNKTCSLTRKTVAVCDSGKASGCEEKAASSSSSEQRTKNWHDGSIQISFSDILTSSMVKVKSEVSKNKKQGDSKFRVISSKKVKMDKNLHIPPNALDSSRPVVKRGKERERPKPKKHTPLKRIILKERIEKKQRRSMLLKEENLKIDIETENGDQFSTENGVKMESEVNVADEENNLPDNLFPEKFALLSLEQSEDVNLDQNLNISVQAELGNLDQDLSVLVEAREESLDQDLSFPGEHIDKSLAENLSILVEAKDGRLDQSLDTTAEAKVGSLCETTSHKICNSSPDEKKLQAVQMAIHTRHFREYCNHLLSVDIDQVTLSLLGDLTRFQDRLHQKDPVKARIKRRLVYGIKEVTKHLKLKKVKCVILAPDSENIRTKGGLNDAVTEIVRVSAEFHIPCVFALRRKTLGKACLKPVPVSCVGVFNYDGSEMNFKKLMELQAESKKLYDSVISSLKELVTEENVEQLIEAQEHSPQSLQSLRATILREKLLVKNPDFHLVFTPLGTIQMGCKEE